MSERFEIGLVYLINKKIKTITDKGNSLLRLSGVIDR